MSYRLALISTEEHCSYIKGILNGQTADCNIDYIYYHSFRELPDLYRQIEPNYDAFCTTGAFARETLIKSRTNQQKQIFTISEKSTEIYRELLTLINENRDTDLTRVMFDYSFCIPNMYFKSANRYLEKEIQHEKMHASILKNMTLDELLDTDETIITNAAAAWKQGQFDLVLCHFSTAYPKLREAEIPCKFIYPAPDNVTDTIMRIVDSLDMEQLNNNLPGIIYLSSPDINSSSADEITPESVNLQKCLLDFNRENTTGFLLKKTLQGFEIYTTQQVLERITEHFTVCQLRRYIESSLGINVHIGYGIGVNVMLARSHAIDACSMSSKSGRSHVITKDGSYIGPLGAQDVQEEGDPVSQKVLQIARATGLSISTLQRISSALELIGSREITTQELAGTLQVTVANTNRFLNALQQNGFAQIVGKKKSLMKGRPSRIYRLEL
ncbi:MAG: hypothetical protein LUK37_01890 [Clostridia bacterium]|nr:hypothetical protein [Clostridia bacterium]